MLFRSFFTTSVFAFDVGTNYNSANMSYPAGSTISQFIVFDSTMQAGGTITFTVDAHGGGGRPLQHDSAKIQIQFFNGGTLLGTKESSLITLEQMNAWSNSPGDNSEPWETLSVTSSNCDPVGSCATVTHMKIVMVGTDSSWWAGNYGPQWRLPTVTYNGGNNLAYNPEFGSYGGTMAQGWASSSGWGACGTTSGSVMCTTTAAGVTANMSGGGYSATGGTTSGQPGGYSGTLSIADANAGTGGGSGGGAAPPTVTSTVVTYSTRTVVSGATTYVYRTPVTTTNYSDGTSTSSSGTEALYQTKVASTVTTNTISGTTLTTISTPINTVTPADGSASFIESRGAATSTSQTVQPGLNFQVWRYDPKNYSCVFGICVWNFTYHTPSTNIANYGNPVNSGTTANGIFIATNSDLPNNDNSLLGANDGTVMRYYGTITAPITTAHPAGSVYRLYFYNNTDDGFVLRINGGTIINQNDTERLQSLFGYTSSGWMDVVAGQTYNLEAWYWNTWGGFGMTFFWDYGAGRMVVPNAALTTGTIPDYTIDTTGMSYSDPSVVNITGFTVSLGPSVEGGTITQTNAPTDQIITRGSRSTVGLSNEQQTRVDTWTNANPRTPAANLNLDVNGSNNTLYIEQVGDSNTVKGIGEAPARVVGSSNSVTVKQGTTGSGQNEIQLRITGDSNSLNIGQARTNTGVETGTNGHYQAIDITGYSNTLTTQQSNTTLGSHYQETTITGNQNNITARQTDNGNKIMFNTVNGNSNSISATQSGTGQHQLNTNLTGNSHSVTVLQDGSSQNKANIDLTNSGGAATLDLQQSGGKNFTIIQNCTNPAGCSTTVRQ